MSSRSGAMTIAQLRSPGPRADGQLKYSTWYALSSKFGPLPTRVPAWLYVAHASPHRGTPTVHEVIAQQLNLSEVRECQIHLRASAVTLTPPDQLTAPISRSLSPSQ